ncbi:hypothetical protein MRX96_013540 [Rhipicephalus microplus]
MAGTPSSGAVWLHSAIDLSFVTSRKAPPAKRPQNTLVAVPRLRPSLPPVEDGYQTAISKAARWRARALKAAAIATDPAVAGTLLYHPSNAGGSFSGSPRLTLAAALVKQPGVTAVRVNYRRNIVAADAATPACVSEFLSTKELSGVAVTAREPADCSSSIGCLHGVDGDLADSELAAGLVSPVTVLALNKEGPTVWWRFTSSTPPDRLALCGLQLRVRHARPHPLQCRQSGRFKHVSEACSRAGACIRCGRQHPAADSYRPRCVNCGGGHPGDTPACPRWQEERKVSTLLATAPTPLSRRGVVKAAVREECREVRSYAAAVRANLTESLTNNPGLQRPTLVPRRSSLPPVSPSTTSPSPASPAEPAQDPRDGLIASLLAALRGRRCATRGPAVTCCVPHSSGGQPGSTQLH